MASRASFAVLFALALSVPSIALALPPSVPALVEEVRIERDAYGVPHVYADTAYGLFWGNGYAQAQDRLFQMDVLRHVGKGEAARFLGPAQLDMDLATRRELYTDEERLARWNALPEDDRRMFQGFADGVNAWIAKTRAVPSLLSAEFYALGHLPEDWQATDTIAIAEFLLDIFGAGSGGNEADNARLLVRLRDTLGAEEAEKAFNDLLWLQDAETYTTIDPSEYTYPATESALDLDALPADQWEVTVAAASAKPFAGGKSLQQAAQDSGLLPGKFGSNALVVAPRFAESGNAMLLGGPQMAYYNPMVPYEVALHGAGFDAVGMGVGGAPGVIIGRSADLAWTVTSGSSDQVDVVAVKLSGPRSYYVQGTSGATADMDCRTEVHVGPPTAIDPNPPVYAVQEVCRTVYGPVFAMNEDAGYAFVRERTHRLDELRSGILWLTLSQADTLEAFQAHMETFRFEFNFHVASSDGRIAYYHFGANPDRDERCDPRLPRLAGMCDWTGVRTGSQLPHIVDPAKGYIVNWNNKPAQGWSSGDSLEKWGPVHRAELFESTVQKYLALDGTLDVQDLRDINVEISTTSPFPENLKSFILDATRSHDDEVVQAARAALDAWAGQGGEWLASDATCAIARDIDPCFGTYEPGFAIYEAWRGIMQEATFADEMGREMRAMGFVPEASSDPHAADHGREDNKDNVLFDALHGRKAHDWCDDVSTSAAESCSEVIVATFEQAVAELTAQYGTTDVSQWRQDVHTIKFVGLSGGPAWRIPMVNRPSFNHLYDLGTGDAWSVLPPGTDQSWAPPDFLRFRADGTLPDAHKDDQLQLYVDFDYKPAQMAPVGVESSETHRVVRL